MGKRKLAQLLDSEDENEEGPAVSKGDQVEAEEGVGGEEKDVKEGEEAMVAVNVAVGSAGVNEEEKEKEHPISLIFPGRTESTTDFWVFVCIDCLLLLLFYELVLNEWNDHSSSQT